MFVNQYFDPTRGSDGLTCDPAAFGLNVFRTLPGVTLTEGRFTTNSVLATLDTEVGAAASAGGFGWRFVTGMVADFRTRGYCSNERLVTRLDDSFRTQVDQNGTVHPNPAGYAMISTRMIPVVRAAVGV